MMTHFLATVEFEVNRSLPDLAAELGRVCGMPLTEEDSGRFEEVPAYVGGSGEVRLTLFGPTEDQDERECVLEISFTTALPAAQARTGSPVFLRPVFDGSEVDSTGHIDCSSQLASLLKANGFSDCRPVHRGN
jgi:hypothetical protein